ncbi:hypothetical protein [Gilvibacter sediminis]|uniref:hypothetical protein n=1 Tax=Gilvibacter sediminis TaxID=379071 RepID=UPI00234FE69E|nr:hypothetical protein [Gilvibacter sediminis]MDC7998403.1 hypothetical protein [Gilvibacter sediminis]
MEHSIIFGMNKASAYEVAVWRAKENPEKNKQLIIEQTNQGLAKLKGFVKRTIYQSIDDPQLLFDWVEWDTMENAIQAAKDMMTIPELKEFVGLIDKTEVFEHYSINDFHSKNNGNSDVIELVVYQLQPEGKIDKFKKAYSTGISMAEGYKNRYVLENSKGENQWAEFVFWERVENAKEASKAMQNNPEIGKVFQMVKEIKLVHQYFQEYK